MLTDHELEKMAADDRKALRQEMRILACIFLGLVLSGVWIGYTIWGMR